MATPVVESTSKGTATSSTTVTVTKPSGTVDGDLLIAVVVVFKTTGATTPSDESGFTTVVSDIEGDVAMKAYSKIASSEGASYTFDVGSSQDELAAFMYRISGHNATTPVSGSSTGSLASTTEDPSVTLSVAPPVSDALLLISALSGNISSADADIDSYVISGTNPTWTEHQVNDTGGSGHLAAICSATANSISTITSLAWNVGGLGSHTGDVHIGTLLVVPATTNATITPGAIALTGGVQAPSPTGDGNIAVAAELTMSLTQNAATAAAPTPDVTNKSKTAALSMTNKTKT